MLKIIPLEFGWCLPKNSHLNKLNNSILMQFRAVFYMISAVFIYPTSGKQSFLSKM